MILINSSGNGVACPIDANYYKGQGERESTEREFLVMIRSAENEKIKHLLSK